MGIWAGHRSYTSTLYEKFYGILNDHRDSGPQDLGLMSHPKDSAY